MFVISCFLYFVGSSLIRGPFLWISRGSIWDAILSCIQIEAPTMDELPDSMTDSSKNWFMYPEYVDCEDPLLNGSLPMELILGFVLHGNEPIVHRIPRLVVPQSMLNGLFFYIFNTMIGCVPRPHAFTIKDYFKDNADLLYTCPNVSVRRAGKANEVRMLARMAKAQGYNIYKIRIRSNLRTYYTSRSYVAMALAGISNILTFGGGVLSYAISIPDIVLDRRHAKITYEIVDVTDEEIFSQGAH